MSSGVARVALACAALAVLPASSAFAQDEVGTARGHLAQDISPHDVAQEPAMVSRTQRVTKADARAAAVAAAADEHVVGRWGPVTQWPVLGTHVALLPNGKVLAYDSVGDNAVETYQVHDHTRATVWDPETGTQAPVWVAGYNVFCSGLAHLIDGSLFLAGGNLDAQFNGIVQTHVFNSATNTWSLGPDMAAGRWYPTVTPLRNGEMLITEGGPDIPEVRTTAGGLRRLTSASQNLPLYPWMDVAPDGRTFYSGPSETMRALDTNANGSWQTYANRDTINRTYGSHALYDVGKIIVSGGAASTRDSRVIDINGSSPQVSRTADMASGRRQHNLTVLSDGSVLATGGNSSGAELVDLANGVYNAERWDPATGAWSTLAAEQVTRQYHSSALLLADGRVLSSGGGSCDDCDAVGYLAKNAQVFTPPYLYKRDGSGELAPRPVISGAPADVKYATTFQIDTPQAASTRKVALIRLGAVTHSVNMEQRYVPLSFTASGGSLTATAPASANIAPPGVYMLVITDNEGVPSVSRMVSLVGNIAPSVALTQPANGASFTEPAAIDVAATASDPDGTVQKVEFFNGATKLGEDSTAPYTYAWTGVTAGGYTLTARVTDDGGGQTTSTARTVAVTAPNAPPAFGNTTIGSSSEPAGGGYKFGSTYVLAEAGTAQAFRFYTRGGASLQRFTPVIYRADASGQPSTFVAAGAEVTIAAGQAPGWVTSALPATPLSAGTYLLGLTAGANGNQASNYYNTLLNGGFWNQNAYGTTPATWGTINREHSAYSFYVTYAPAVTAPPPANTAPPAITGTTTSGSLLTASAGSWTNSPTSFAYRWRRCDAAGGSCTDIAGAQATTYTLTSAEAGSTVRVVVTATNGGGSTSATSAATAVIAPAPPANTALPVVSGTARSGQTLSTTDGTWTGSPTGFAYRWRRCDTGGAACADIAGATARTYALDAGDVGKTIRSVVLATNGGGSASATSAATAVIVPEPPANTALPQITGAAVNGAQLSASTGTWTNVPTGYTHQWRRCDAAGAACSNIGGATQSTYTLTGADVAATLRVVVTATNAGGQAGATSDATGVVAPAAPTNTAQPAIAGTTASGQTLTASDGTWAGSPTGFTRQWRRCDGTGASCADVPGATSSTYALTDADVGGTLRIVVTATNVTGSTDATSNPTAVVRPAAPANTAPPVISGSAVNGSTLSATDGTWTGDPTGYARQWRRCDASGGGCADIAGATGPSLGLTAGDVGRTLRIVVTASGAGGSATATSGQTAVVAEAPSAPANAVAPTVSGTPAVGQTLTATTGSWTGFPAPALVVQWQSCLSQTCTDIAGAQGSSYVARTADAGRTLRVLVTGTNASGSASVPSAQTMPVTTGAATGRFGAEIPGPLFDQPRARDKFASIYRLDQPARLTDFRFFARGGPWGQQFVPAVYSTSAGRPATLITKGPTVTVAADSAAAWRVVSLPANVTLQPGDYALALLPGTISEGAFIAYEAAPGASWWNRDGWPNPSTSWGAIRNADGRWSFQVTYAVAGT